MLFNLNNKGLHDFEKRMIISKILRGWGAGAIGLEQGIGRPNHLDRQGKSSGLVGRAMKYFKW